MDFIYDLIKKIFASYLVLRIVLEIVPGQRYRKYVKLFGSFFLILAMLQSLTLGIPFIKNLSIDQKILDYQDQLDSSMQNLQSTGNSMDEVILSTMNEEVKRQFNNKNTESENEANADKIRESEDNRNIEYGSKQENSSVPNGNVDKSANISVQKIIVRQQEEDLNR